MKSLRFHESAERELREIALFYRNERPGLEDRWTTSFEDVAHKIKGNPATGHLIGSRTRQRRIPVFPYAIVFQNRTDDIYIVAIIHLRRKPGYWIDRLEDSEP